MGVGNDVICPAPQLHVALKRLIKEKKTREKVDDYPKGRLN